MQKAMKASWQKPIVQKTACCGKIIRKWKSLKEAESKGFDSGAICNNLKRKSKTAYGFVWKYDKNPK
jgi:hypothetical protein